MEKKIKYSKTYLMINIVKNKIKMKQGDFEEEKELYTFVGINLLGDRTVLGVYIDKKKDNRFFLDIMEEFKSKGIEKVYFIVCLKEQKLIKGIKVSYPNALIVSSLTMNIINLWKVFTERGRDKMTTKIKKLYIQDTYEEAKVNLDLLKENYQDNPLVLLIFDKYLGDIEEYYSYDKEVRKFLFNHYSFTNLYDIIRRNNEKVKFKDIEEILNALNETFNNIERNKPYTKSQWTKILNHCSNYFDNILEEMIIEV